MNFLAVFGVGVFQLLCTFHFTTGQEPTFDQTEVLQRPRFFKYRRVQLDSPVPVPPKPSFNSILSSKVVVVKQNGDQGQADQSNATETFNRLTEAKEENETEAVFVPTSGVRKPCKTHSDCYGMCFLCILGDGLMNLRPFRLVFRRSRTG